ncbi:serine protease [Streptomyces mirabilis]|uniref:S1 family peptidase n=1 Tax=Streptomyces mirabilis TaxID=68239 RepID=UPI0038053F57
MPSVWQYLPLATGRRRVAFYGQVVLALGRVGAGQGSLLGSCFPISSRHLATAMHVVGPSDRNLVALAPMVSGPNDYQDTTQTNFDFFNVKIVAANPLRDVCILEAVGGSAALINYTLTDTDTVSAGSEVQVYGYPHMDFGRRIVTLQHAHIGAKVLIPNNGVKSKHVVINAHMRPGQSGGPVFDVATNSVCAMVTGSYVPDTVGGMTISGVDPTTLHQTSHAISAEYIREMMQ